MSSNELSTPTPRIAPLSARVTLNPVTIGATWLTVAVSSIVFFEPAPYDAITAGLALALFAMGMRLPNGIGAPLSLLAIYLSANVIAAIGMSNPGDAFTALGVRSYLVLSWILFVCLICEQPKRMIAVIWNGYIAAAGIAVVLGLAGYFDVVPGLDGQVLLYDRVRGTFKDPNVFGPFLVPPCLYLISRILRTTSAKKKTLLVIILLLLLLGILLSFSRGAWVDLVIAFTTYFLLQTYIGRSPRQRMKLVAFTVATLLVAAVALSAALLSEEFDDMFSDRAEIVQDYDSDRFSAQREALQLSLTTPFGVGPSQSADALSGLPPHNLFLHVLIEAGWLGALAFVWFILLSLSRGLAACMHQSSMQADNAVVFACLVGLLAQSLFIDSTHWRHFFLLLALLWGADLSIKRWTFTR